MAQQRNPGLARAPHCASLHARYVSRGGLGVLPSPLWGGVGGGGRRVRQRWCVTCITPSLPSPTRGEGTHRVCGAGEWEFRMVVLGIETTCDETAAAVVERLAEGPGRILSNIVLSQIDEHAAFGGVVPEIAARAHVEA